jgi:hypothetical protein
MRALAYAMGILALLPWVLILLVVGRSWSDWYFYDWQYHHNEPDWVGILISLVPILPVCVIPWAAFSGRIIRYPEPVSVTYFVLFVIGTLLFGTWYFAGGVCQLELWLTGHTCFVYL